MRAIPLPGWLRTAAVLALGIAAYSNTARAPFLYDDYRALANNETIRSLSSRILTPPRETTVAGRPVANLSFALNYAVSGLRLPPLHLTNLALHLCAGLLLLALVRRTLLLPRLRDRWGPHAGGLALCAALLWVLHPLQTESVTYLVQRTEVLAGLFLLSTLYASLRAFEAARPFAWSAAAVLACGLGMGSKETMAVAPALAVLYDRAFHFGSLAEALRRRWRLYAALAATWVVVALQASTGPRRLSAGFHFSYLRPHQYLGIQLGAIVHYLRLVLAPVGLVFDYGEPGSAVPLVHSIAEWGPQAAILAPLAALAAWAWLRHPAAGFLAVSFFILLAPSSSVVPINTEAMAEHRLYLPLAPALILLALGVHQLVRRPRWLPAALGAAAVAALGLLSFQRNAVYRTQSSLWADTARKRPRNARAFLELSRAYRAEGDPARAQEAYGQAIQLAYETYGEALRRDPGYSPALQQMGLLEEGRASATHDAAALDRAIGYYQRYLGLEPGDRAIQARLARCLELKGRVAR